jgi:AraC family transcriptional regulator
MKTQTWHTYRELAASAVELICRGLDDDLSCQTIADRLCVSPFHFHRIFKAVYGEAPSEMAMRLRMERAFSQLINSETSVTEIAFEAGFESLEGFSRHFRARFGTAPTQIRRLNLVERRTLYAPNGIHWQPGEFIRNINLSGESQMSLDTTALRIEEIADVRLAALRHIGPYYEIGNTFSKLRPPTPGTTTYALYYDDPESTPPDQLRSDACYELQEEEEPCDGTEVVKINGGKYVVYRHTGSYTGLNAAWGTFMKLLANSDYCSRPGPCFELYVDNCMVTQAESLRTDLYAPIR